jgi:hypothetical protein
MNMLVLGLYVEGSTDHRFLSSVIERTTQQVLLQHEQIDTDPLIIPIQLTTEQKKDRAESILQAARSASGFHILIVHADADSPASSKALVERIEPGLKLVQETQEDVCRDLVPIIPVQAVEAWMLADHERLLAEVRTTMHPPMLGIPERAIQVESIAKPKQLLKEVVRKAYASQNSRRRDTGIDFLYEPIGERISLERLRQLPSYQQFVVDLTETLVILDFIPRMHRL